MMINFHFPDGPKQFFCVSPTATVRTARHLFSILLGVQESSLTLLHLGRPLPDTTVLHSLNFSVRNFITIHVKKMIRRPIIPPNYSHESSLEPIVRALRLLLRDVRVDNLLDDPLNLQDLSNPVARNDPSNIALFPNNPHFLLELFGIPPGEFLEPIDE
jgi:hypothetical protein